MLTDTYIILRHFMTEGTNFFVYKVMKEIIKIVF